MSKYTDRIICTEIGFYYFCLHILLFSCRHTLNCQCVYKHAHFSMYGYSFLTIACMEIWRWQTGVMLAIEAENMLRIGLV